MPEKGSLTSAGDVEALAGGYFGGALRASLLDVADVVGIDDYLVVDPVEVAGQPSFERGERIAGDVLSRQACDLYISL